MAIDLIVSEKRTFFRFLSLYLGSSFIFLLFIAFFYFQHEKQLYFDLTKSNMQNIASKISSNIILSHMTNTSLDKSKFLETKDYKVSFYNKNKEKVFGNLEEKVDLSKNIIKHEENFILIDRSTLGHLGIYYIAIKEDLYFKRINSLIVNISILFFGIYFFIGFIGFYLARLFLKPIRNERIKLNNFIKDTTHELNTPISAILMSTEDNNLNEKQVERIRLSAKRLSEVYKDLSYIFLNEPKKSVDNELKLDELLEEQIKYFEILAKKKKIKLNIEINEFKYKINRDDFLRVVNNLISNAIKYNNINGELSIILKNNILSIKDTGIGIQKDRINDIFKRYYRATPQEGGFGIGLSIVKNICEQYKIKIEVKSEYKKGTEFKLIF